MEKNRKCIEYISKRFEKFDRILLFSGNKNEKLLKEFYESDVLSESNKKILILSTSNMADILNGKHEYHRISEEEQEFLVSLYSTYEFSDRFQVISDNLQYGSLLNYVKTGIMTIEEFFQAILA